MSQKDAYDHKGRRKYLNRAEGAAFVKNTDSLTASHALFCLTLYYTGCRISECLSLCNEDIDFENNTLLIKSKKKRGKNEIRRIPVPAPLPLRLETLNTKANQSIWPFSRTTAWRIVKRVMHMSNVSGPQATAKGLRHSFGVRGVMSRIPITLIQKWMGHTDVTTTAIYLAVKDEEERRLISRTWKTS